MSEKVIEMLKDDANYYGEFGRSFLSNSDIGTLLNNPADFGIKREDDKALAQGRLFHQLLLEPEKAEGVIHVDVSTRTTKAYKEALESHGVSFLLLTSEVEEIMALAARMVANIAFYDAIYDSGNAYEVPAIGEIQGQMFKGKSDIVGTEFLIDLKTTSDIMSFKYSAKKYNYDSQAYIYGQLFGKPLVFYVIDKATMQLGIFTPTDEFIAGGKEKVRRAIEVYRNYFAEGHPGRIEDHCIIETLW
jgi:hypothetical protein